MITVRKLLAFCSGGTLSQAIEKEFTSHGDIILGNFVDTYQNLTLKSLSALNFFLDVCPSTKLLYLIDDDVEFQMEHQDVLQIWKRRSDVAIICIQWGRKLVSTFK